MFFSSRIHRRLPRRFGALMLSGALVASFSSLAVTNPAGADTIGSIDFETGYTLGDIDGQNGWSKTGDYDVEVADVGTFEAADGYGFGTKALRASNATTSNGFGDHTFSPGLADDAGEGGALPYYTAAFKIGTAMAVEQSDLSMSVSPDNGEGGRLSYLRFDDEAGGVRLTFGDSVNAGPLPGTPTTWRYTDLGLLSRAESHSISFAIAFVEGPGNDVVKIFVDGVLAHTGTTWENYYRYSVEQTPTGNLVPPISKLLFLFRSGSGAAPEAADEGFLIDRVRLTSNATAPPVPSGPPTAPGDDYVGNMKCADMAPDNVTWQEFKIEGVPDDGDHKIPNSELVVNISNASSQTFDWESNFDMSAVLVKGSNGGIHYQYPGTNDTSDTGLHALVHDETKPNPYHGISHVSFCYQVGGDTPVDEPVVPTEPENPVAPQQVNPASEDAKDKDKDKAKTTVLGETLVRGRHPAPHRGGGDQHAGPHRRLGPGPRPDDAHARPTQDRDPQQLIGRTPRGGHHTVPAPPTSRHHRSTV